MSCVKIWMLIIINAFIVFEKDNKCVGEDCHDTTLVKYADQSDDQ